MEREFLNGKKLAAWIKDYVPEWRALTGDNFARALYRWENEGEVRPKFYDVDHYFIDLGINEHEVPDEIWEEKGTPRKMKSPTRIRVEEMLDEGYAPAEIRAHLKDLNEWWDHASSFRNWVSEWKQQHE